MFDNLICQKWSLQIGIIELFNRSGIDLITKISLNNDCDFNFSIDFLGSVLDIRIVNRNKFNGIELISAPKDVNGVHEFISEKGYNTCDCIGVMCSAECDKECDNFINFLNEVYDQKHVYKILIDDDKNDKNSFYSFQNWNTDDDDKLREEVIDLFSQIALDFSTSDDKNIMATPALPANFSKSNVENIISQSGNGEYTFILTESQIGVRSSKDLREVWFHIDKQLIENHVRIIANYNGDHVLVVSLFNFWLISGIPFDFKVQAIDLSKFTSDPFLKDVVFIGNKTILFVFNSSLVFIDVDTLEESTKITKYENKNQYNFRLLKLFRKDNDDFFNGMFLTSQENQFIGFTYNNGKWSETIVSTDGNKRFNDFEFFEQSIIFSTNQKIFYCPINEIDYLLKKEKIKLLFKEIPSDDSMILSP